uniref:Tyrosine-protein kinase ephrin type A/B receptor-like domain-containing protein n=1 Tax=Pyrodinium bahamense TaxID=73915 RepID=A0A7S0B8G9_9DINO
MYADKMGLERCLPCPEPFLTKAQGSTSKSLCGCPPGTFLGADNTCEECALGLFCPGFGQALEAAPGYMLLGPDDSRRLAEGSDDAPVGRLAGPPPDVYRCLPAEVCPGGPPGVCTGGRVGRGCSGCPDGQAMDGGECEPCENAGGGWMLALWWFLVIGCSLCLFIVGSIYSHSRASASELALSGAASSLVMILQVLGLISLLTIPWPTALRTFVHNLEIFLFDASAHFGFECVASSPMQKFAVNASTLPVALMTIGMSFVFGRFFFVAREVAAIKNVAGMLLYLGFLPLITSALVPMMCYKHPAGTRSLIKFPAILCGSDIHHAMLAIAVPLLACALAFLAYLIALAWWAPAKSACSDESARAAFLRSTKFIFERCRPDQWFWGCFVLPRSLLMSMVPVLAPDDSRVQVVLFASLLAVYMVLQVRVWPWRVPVMNVLDLVVAMLLVLAIVTAGVAFVPLASTSSSSSGFASLLILFLMAPLFLTGCVFLGAGIVTFHRRFMARGAEDGTVVGCDGRRSSWISASSVFPQTLQSQGLAEELAAQSAALQDMSAEEVRSLVWSLEVYDSYAVAAALSALAAAGLNPKHRRQSWHSEGSQTRKGRLPSRILLHTPFTGKDTLDVKEDRRPEDRGAGGRGPHGDVQHPFGVPCGDAEELSLDALPGGPSEDSSRDGAREVSADLTGILPTTSTPSIVPAGLFAKGARPKEENTDLI